MSDFLFEIGLEEVPARMIASAEAELLRRTLAMLGKESLLGDGFDPLTGTKSYSTPRRLAVLVKNVKAHQADIIEEVTGPATKIAFKDGVPTPAAEAFARKSGVGVSELRKIDTPKGEYLAATSVKKGRSASEVIASELPKEIAAIYWAKSMYWRAGKPERFVRPVMWMVCLLGESVVPVEFGGKTAGRASFGHRVLSKDKSFEIKSPQSYLTQLEGEYVLADVETRRQKIRKALDHVTRTVAGGRWREDEALVDTVTHLTEWPDVLLGNFEAAYLELPEEVLVTVMRDHQKYFAVEDVAGKLVPHFLAVVNIALDEKNAAIIKQGNERVLRARFNDARFFWEFDQRTPLSERVKLLENVTFHKLLGTYAKKMEQVKGIVKRFIFMASSRGKVLNEDAIYEATELAKTDLTTELVKEFTELQGIIGGLYAKRQGYSDAVATAVYDQYMPASADDPIPRSSEGCVLGLADRIDTIAGMFAHGMEPTGSKDPYALRRAANAIVRILAESMLPLTISDMSTVATSLGAANLGPFFAERVDFYLREVRGQAYDVVKAVMASSFDDLRDTVARAEAVTSVRGSEDFLAVCAAFKRMKNILVKADESGVTAIMVDLPAQVTMHPAQNDLNNALTKVSGAFAELCSGRRYVEALKLLATIRPQVDAFMDPKTGVKVMDDVPYVRETRLNLLRQVLKNFSAIADFSEIVVS